MRGGDARAGVGRQERRTATRVVSDGCGAIGAAMIRERNIRITRPLGAILAGLAGALLIRLLVVALVAIPIFPRREWDSKKTQLIGGGVTVARQTHVNRFGFPLECVDFRRHAWSATSQGQPIELTDEHVQAFADLEFFDVVKDSFRLGAAPDKLEYRSARREETLLRTHPRASNCVVRWGILGLNAVVCCLLGGGFFYLRHRRRLSIANRRRRSGLCVKCGYNLTGNVSGRCPECGEAT